MNNQSTLFGLIGLMATDINQGFNNKIKGIDIIIKQDQFPYVFIKFLAYFLRDELFLLSFH